MQNNSSSYIEILKQSLIKKLQVLDKIEEQNKIQENLAKAEKFDYDAFEQTLVAKEQFIKQLDSMDAGFQSVFDRLKETIVEHRQEYAADIRDMKQLIARITDKSMDIMTQEKRNKELILNRKEHLKKEVKTARTSNKVAANYYKMMSNLNVVDSQFIDRKK